VPAFDAGRAARQHAGERDCYLGLNPYRSRRGPLAGIRALYADLDYYKMPAWAGADPRDVLAAVLSALERAGVPSPDLAVATGRGLQLAWLVNAVRLRAAPKAVAAMRRLVKLLQDFGADGACADVKRVFRIPGTVNAKNGKLARLLICEPHRHDFDHLCRSILGPKPERQSRRRPEKSTTARNPSLAHKRLAEIQALILMRWRGKVPEG
jgi:hypothetical protein